MVILHRVGRESPHHAVAEVHGARGQPVDFLAEIESAVGQLQLETVQQKTLVENATGVGDLLAPERRVAGRRFWFLVLRQARGGHRQREREDGEREGHGSAAGHVASVHQLVRTGRRQGARQRVVGSSVTQA